MADGGSQPPRWPGVRLTEACQVARLMGLDEDAWPPAETRIVDQYDALRREGRASDAIAYLAHALPRLEAVVWAIQIVAHGTARTPPSIKAQAALDAALRWRRDRSEQNRHAARTASEALARPVAERHLGAAIFYSGGSIAPPGQPPLMPPDHVAARYVAAAIGQIAYRSDDPTRILEQALDLGERIADRGLAAVEN